MNIWLANNSRGLFFTVALGLISILLASFIPGFNGIMLGLILGIAVGNIVSLPNNFRPGIGYSGSRVLEFAIVLMAFTINFGHFAQLGWKNLLLVVLVIVGVLMLTIFFSKKMKCPGSTGYLVGFGTAICGSAAIAAVAPGITKNNEDIGISFAVVNLMGSLGMIAFPFVLSYVAISEVDSGVMIGATLHSVGNVAGAGYGLEKLVGDTAISIKMARVAMLSPAVILFTFMVNRKSEQSWKENFKLPLYLWAFITITVLTSFIDFPEVFLSGMSVAAEFLLTIAMVAIGLKVSFRELYKSGRKALTFGVVIFAAQIALVAGLLLVFG